MARILNTIVDHIVKIRKKDMCFIEFKGEYVITEHNTNTKHQFDSIESLIKDD